MTHRPPFTVVHIPHSSLKIPEELVDTFELSGSELDRELVTMTDHFTDELFALPLGVATTVIHSVSRLVVDPERFEADDREGMASKGMGVIYTMTSDGRALRKPPTPGERSALLDRFYRPHHARLSEAVQAAVDAHGRCLLIDGHSFPSRPLSYEEDQASDRPDICIGADDYHTPTWLRDEAVSQFAELGLSIAVNRPFSGALVPSRFFQRDTRVLAIMVELNRSLYLDEGQGTKAPDFEIFRSRLTRTLTSIIQGAASS